MILYPPTKANVFIVLAIKICISQMYNQPLHLQLNMHIYTVLFISNTFKEFQTSTFAVASMKKRPFHSLNTKKLDHTAKIWQFISINQHPFPSLMHVFFSVCIHFIFELFLTYFVLSCSIIIFFPIKTSKTETKR